MIPPTVPPIMGATFELVLSEMPARGVDDGSTAVYLKDRKSLAFGGIYEGSSFILT